MGIYVGNSDKPLQAKADGNTFEQKYYRELKEINSLFDRFRAKDGNSIIQISQPEPKEGRQRSLTSKRVKVLPPIGLPAEVPFYDTEVGSTNIRYSKLPPTRSGDNKLSWETREVRLNETRVIKEDEKDLAWFLLYACNLLGKGIYQLVDNERKYEGSFNDILVTRDVMNALDPKDEDLVRYIAQKFVTENVMNTPVKTLIVDTCKWFEANKKWGEGLKAIESFNSKRAFEKQGISELEWEGQPVDMIVCPMAIKQVTLIEQANELGIPLTTPVQTKNILYSLIKHVEKVKELA